jgi:GNAT superfamily N-acetyltransferase
MGKSEIMVQSRPYNGEADYRRVRQLLIESYSITRSMQNWSLDCWDWFRYNGRVEEEIADSRGWEEDVHLWVRHDGKLVGSAILDGGYLSLQVHPSFRHIENQMLDWAEANYLAGRNDEVDNRLLNTQVFDYDHERQALLDNRGYRNLGHDSTMRQRPLDQPIPEFELPSGFYLRHLDANDREDLARRAEIANRSFDVTKHSAETIRTLQKAPTYRPELDLVTVGPDGAFAAYCVVWFDAANRIGVFGPVGTHPAHRRRGLGKAMMSVGLHRLRALKAGMAYVHCGLEPAPNRLYESAGFGNPEYLYHWQRAFE